MNEEKRREVILHILHNWWLDIGNLFRKEKSSYVRVNINTHKIR